MIELDLYSTLVVASMVLILGQFLVARISVIRKYSIPEPVVGGLVVALILFALHSLGGTSVRFDNSLSRPLMLAFFASIGLFGALVFYKRSYNEFEAVAKVNREALLAFAGEINGLVSTSKKVEESEKVSEQALSAANAQSEEIKKAIQGFTAAHNALAAKIPPAGAYDKPIATLKQAIDDLTAANKSISARLVDMQQAQIARDQAPPPPVEKPRAEAPKKPPKRNKSVASRHDSLLRYP